MGFGFTIIGGDRPGEPLQIKRIMAGSVAERDGRLMMADILVSINGISVLTYSHRKVVELFRSLQIGMDATIEVRRGYPLPDNDFPEGKVMMARVVKGPLGFGFSLGEWSYVSGKDRKFWNQNFQ